MESNLTNILEEFALLLKTTFSGPSTQAIKEAEEKLKEYAKEPKKLVDLIGSILMSDIQVRKQKSSKLFNNFRRWN